MAYIVIRARKYLTVTVAYGTCTMPIWLTTTCPETLIVTLWGVLKSGNAKIRVNLTCSVCAGLMSVGHARLSLTISRELVFDPQLGQKKISTPSFLHCSAQSGSRG